jgi:topoisomerase-4 subunit A
MEENKIEKMDFGDALSERYLSYALSTIMSRSLPDVRDGLKPVHRRLLYAMLELRLDAGSGFKKCARIVGDVIGKYHPHGDTAVYDSLVRLAQSFSLRYPLIDGQGNFGSIDGDNAAAMRYTESRMTEICRLLMEDIDKEVVDFVQTYDNSDMEPVILPSLFPNLLANGSEGIAVGMATSIPPHNLHELCDALIHLIDNPEADSLSLMKFIKGPDFPTGGVIVDNMEMIKQFYTKGKGSFRVRAKWHKETLNYGQYQIIITELPYQVQKSKLIEHMASLINDKKLPLIANLRDESTEDVRLIIEPKDRTCDEFGLMESLFKLTSLENRIQLNMNVVSSRQIPRIMNILEILQEFVDHRKIILTRKFIFMLTKINSRLEILEGLKIAYLNLEKIISIIRDEDEPKELLMEQLKFNDTQAESILNIKLRALHKLEKGEIIREAQKLEKEAKDLREILDDQTKLMSILRADILNVQNKFGYDSKLGARRTSFEEIESDVQIPDISAFITKEPITIISSEMGWIRSIKNHNNDLSIIKYKEGDREKFILETFTTDKILILSSSGKFFTLLADNISKSKVSAESIKLMVDLLNDEINNIFIYKPDQKILLVSTSGHGFIVNSNELVAQTRSGKQIFNIKENELCRAFPVSGDMVAVIGENRKLLIFEIDQIPEMKKGQGVILQKYNGSKLIDVKIFNRDEGLTWNFSNKLRAEKDISAWHGKRGSVGKLPPSNFPKNKEAFSIFV